MPVSSPTRVSLRIGGKSLSPLMAMMLLALRDLEVNNRGVPVTVTIAIRDTWRRLLAANLTFDEWRRKAFRKTTAASWMHKTLRALRDQGCVGQAADSFLVLTDAGRALAEQARPLFERPLGGMEFRAYCEASYIRITGRVE